MNRRSLKNLEPWKLYSIAFFLSLTFLCFKFPQILDIIGFEGGRLESVLTDFKSRTKNVEQTNELEVFLTNG